MPLQGGGLLLNLNTPAVNDIPQMFGEFGFLFGRRFAVANLRRADKGL
jgi:hypothetical protein